MTTNMSIFTPALMGTLNLPTTQGRSEWCDAWAAGENTNALWNPFATTWGDPALELSSNAYFNSFGPNNQYHVRNYRDLPSGVLATANTIRQTSPVSFGLILSSLQQERVLKGVAELIRDSWGTVGFANRLLAGYTPTGWTSDYVVTPGLTPLDELKIALFAGKEQPSLTTPQTRLDYANYRISEIVAGHANSLLELATTSLVPDAIPEHQHVPGGVKH